LDAAHVLDSFRALEGIGRSARLLRIINWWMRLGLFVLLLSHGGSPPKASLAGE
jgi:hypothetical protein